MKAELQNIISPVERSKVLAPIMSDSGKAPPGVMEGGEDKIDFKELLLNSNTEEAKAMSMKKESGLAGAKSYEDFLGQLNKQTQQQRVPRNTLSKDDFLNLFITQLQNQDPLKPKDGTEMASQIAQFNSLEQMMNVNKTLERMEKSADASNNNNFLNYIGKDVTLYSGKAKIEEGVVKNLSVKLDTQSVDTKLTLKDSKGNVVATKDLGPMGDGEQNIIWDSVKDSPSDKKITDGVYTFNVEAKSQGGAKLEAKVISRVGVEGVDFEDGKPSLKTNIGAITPKDVQGIRLP